MHPSTKNFHVGTGKISRNPNQLLTSLELFFPRIPKDYIYTRFRQVVSDVCTNLAVKSKQLPLKFSQPSSELYFAVNSVIQDRMLSGPFSSECRKISYAFCVGFPSLHFLIGPENLRYSLHQSNSSHSDTSVLSRFKQSMFSL